MTDRAFWNGKWKGIKTQHVNEQLNKIINDIYSASQKNGNP